MKCDVEGAEAEVAAKLARYGVSLRQYKKSLMEEELLPTRIRYKVSLEMLLSAAVERIVFTCMKTGLSWTSFTQSTSATGTQQQGPHQPLWSVMHYWGIKVIIKMPTIYSVHFEMLPQMHQLKQKLKLVRQSQKVQSAVDNSSTVVPQVLTPTRSPPVSP